MQHSAYLLGIEIWVRFLSFLLFFSLAPKPKYISQYELMLGFKNKTKTKLDLWYLWFYFKQLTISMPMTQILIYFFFFFFFFHRSDSSKIMKLAQRFLGFQIKLYQIRVYYNVHLLSFLLCSPYRFPFKLLSFVSCLEK